MNFPLLPYLLEKGNVVLWDIRGMGMSDKNDSFYSRDPETIADYYL